MSSMGNYWIVSWTRENFDIYKNRGHDVAGFPESRANLAKSMKAGDRIIFYILREQLLVAICNCTSPYFYDTTPIWPDNTYPHRIHTKALAEGTLDYRRIRNQLQLTKGGKIPPGGELKGSPRKIAYEDYKVIESNFTSVSTTERVSEKPLGERTPQPPGRKSSHEELVKIIEEIGKSIGKWVGREQRIAEYRHDIVWKEEEFLSPSVVIEVCDSGNLEKDILALEWASKRLKAIAILVVINENDFNQAKRRLPLASPIIIVRAESVKQLGNLVQNDLNLLKAVFNNV